MILTFPVERTEHGQQQQAWDHYQCARWSRGMDALPLVQRTPGFERRLRELLGVQRP
jgi:hypothetical protein